MALDILIQTVAHKDQRYDTLGDYQSLTGDKPVDQTPGQAYISVSAMGDWRSELLVAIHELIELATACWVNGVPDERIVAFDKMYDDMFKAGMVEFNDPGADPAAPYHTQHMLATFIESGLLPHFKMAEYVHFDNMDRATDDVKEETSDHGC
jgi:hypothetical protein